MSAQKNRLSFVFLHLERHFRIRYKLWGIGPLTIVVAFGAKGRTPSPPNETVLSEAYLPLRKPDQPVTAPEASPKEDR